LGYMHVNGPAGRAAQKATQVILLCRHGGEKQTSSNRRDRLYHVTHICTPYITFLRVVWNTLLFVAKSLRFQEVHNI